MTADYDINIISATSLLRKLVRLETTEGSSTEFIGYWIPQHEQNGCINQRNCAGRGVLRKW